MRIRYLSQKIIKKNQDLASINKKQLPKLTQQEEKILKLIGDGKSNKEIAIELFIELSTVKTHINKLYTKLKIKNRNEARQKVKTLASIEV